VVRVVENALADRGTPHFDAPTWRPPRG
jgi:hypothetical protein